MEMCQFCTPGWLEQSSRIYKANPIIKYKLKNLTAKICCRVSAYRDWEISEDIIFGIFLDRGELKTLKFFTEDEAFQESEYLMAAMPREWKKILRKEHEFVTSLMLSKVTLELGTKIKMLELSFHMNNVFDFLAPGDLQFPDEMSKYELTTYRSIMETFRRE